MEIKDEVSDRVRIDAGDVEVKRKYRRCECCGDDDSAIHVHKIEKNYIFNGFVDNLIMLCEKCEKKAKSGEITKDRLQKIVKMRPRL